MYYSCEFTILPPQIRAVLIIRIIRIIPQTIGRFIVKADITLTRTRLLPSHRTSKRSDRRNRDKAIFIDPLVIHFVLLNIPSPLFVGGLKDGRRARLPAHLLSARQRWFSRRAKTHLTSVTQPDRIALRRSGGKIIREPRSQQSEALENLAG